MPASQKSSKTDSLSEIVTFSDLASEYEKILTENRYGSVGWILLHSKIQKCYCLCRSVALCSDETKEDDSSSPQPKILQVKKTDS